MNFPEPAIANQVSQLSAGEREVVVLIAQGLTARQIAHELKKSRFTIRNKVTQIHLKLRTTNISTLTAWVLRTGLLDHPEWYDADGRFVGGSRPAA